eukprot:TRINITY_DN15634_c0_g2_i1.p1 TRINITY_DN15634_c0_g2~~TRINITY_DN15634_c0_g2_i1.p1  ORF type:complete len:600 (+),score=105.49 TRINITY_DN15634_c0_g2_i1:87-1886(+)
MKVIVNCDGQRLEVPCGAGKQHMRWLGLVVATRIQKERYPHAFRVPQRVLNSEGQTLRPRQVIGDVLAEGEEVTVELRQGAAITEDDVDSTEWTEDAYGPHSNLMECRFKWKVGGQSDFPKAVRGDYVVADRWKGVYSQKDYGGRFEIPVEPVDVGPDQVDWIATRKGAPGSCTYKFVMQNDVETVCKADPDTMTADGQAHYTEFTWDVPIAPEPYPEIDSRPSTASSRDGAQVDPRFEQDWEALRLKWVESFMKVRVKDVLTEFYAILIDLFDSYAFMGLELSASQHTIGMDDWKHLIINCGLLEGQPEGSLSWDQVGEWFEDAAGVRDGRPYLAQRLTRAHYLELLMRTAGHTMCDHPRGQYAPEAGRPPMPLDEGLFRFITDILIPVMDIYDDDPIRKDAVQHQNLVVIQQNRPSIRSIYSFLSQPWPYCDGEQVVIPATLKYVLDFALEKLQEAEGGGAPPPPKDKDDGAAEGEAAAPKVGGPDFAAALGGEERLSIEQLEVIVEDIEGIIQKVTGNHPETMEQRALLFWEFFEVVMECCRNLADKTGTPIDQGIPAFVQTQLAFMGLVDLEEASLPAPNAQGDEEEEVEEGAAE